MPRSMVGLPAAVGATVSGLAALAHNNVAVVIIAVTAGAATGSAAYLALPPSEPKTPLATQLPAVAMVKKNALWL